MRNLRGLGEGHLRQYLRGGPVGGQSGEDRAGPPGIHKHSYLGIEDCGPWKWILDDANQGTANAVWVHAHPGFKSPILRL